jgi:hypothetical protein
MKMSFVNKIVVIFLFTKAHSTLCQQSIFIYEVCGCDSIPMQVFKLIPELKNGRRHFGGKPNVNLVNFFVIITQTWLNMFGDILKVASICQVFAVHKCCSQSSLPKIKILSRLGPESQIKKFIVTSDQLDVHFVYMTVVYQVLEGQLG